MNPVWSILLLSLVAGLGTGLGGLIAIIRKPGKRSFGLLMGMAAGVMISLSFLELVNEAWELQGWLVATIGFSLGSMFMFSVDFMVPHIRFGESEADLLGGRARLNPVQPRRFGHFGRQHPRHAYFEPRIYDQKLLKTGILIAIGITIHNIPEGIAVGAGYMHTPEFGFFIAIAILLHNIPEGIATALPLCKSGMCRWDSFKFALFSGLAEPLGALAAAFFLSAFEALIPAALAFAGGVMVFITLDELIPAAREHGHQHYTAMGIILGAIFVFVLSGLFGV
ncbi:MAG: ZIP family metal transporter [Anaerolineales bacterium]|nr:ZIP family metal transporter [Anaerolineales bacterium]